LPASSGSPIRTHSRKAPTKLGAVQSSDLDVARSDADRSSVAVSFRVEGSGDWEDLAQSLSRMMGVTDVGLLGDDET